MQENVLKKLNKNSTLFVWLDSWHESKENTISEETQRMYRNQARLIKSHLPNYPIKKYNPNHIQQLIDTLYRKGYSKSYIKKSRVTLNQVFDFAREAGKIKTNPVSEIFVPKDAPKKKVTPLSIQEQEIVEAECEECTNGEMMLFLLDTGIRRGEMTKLKWINFNKYEKYIFIEKSKTDNGIRIIPLTTRAYDIIIRQPRINKFIFNSTIGKPITYTVLRKLYERVRKKTGIDKLTNHVCRHTFATRAVERGMNLKSIADLLGHSDVNFTCNTYVTTNLNYLQKQMSLMEFKKSPKDISNLISSLGISFEEILLYLAKQ